MADDFDFSTLSFVGNDDLPGVDLEEEIQFQTEEEFDFSSLSFVGGDASGEPDYFTAPEEDDSVITSGLKAGIDKTQAMGGGLVNWFGSVIDNEDLQKWGEETYQDNMYQASQNASPVGGFMDVWESEKNWVDKLSDYGDWVLWTIGDLVPTMVMIAAPGGIGTKIGEKLATSAAQKALTAGATAERAAQIVGRGRLAGQATGAMGASTGMETGMIQMEIQDETGENRPAVAMSFAAMAGVLDALPIMYILNRHEIGKDVTKAVLEKIVNEGIIKRIGKGAATQMVFEGTTEAFQTVIEKAALTHVDGRDLWTPELWREMIDTFAAGALMGKVMGGVEAGATYSSRKDNAVARLNKIKQAEDNQANRIAGQQTGRVEPPPGGPSLPSQIANMEDFKGTGLGGYKSEEAVANEIYRLLGAAVLGRPQAGPTGLLAPGVDLGQIPADGSIMAAPSMEVTPTQVPVELVDLGYTPQDVDSAKAALGEYLAQNGITNPAAKAAMWAKAVDALATKGVAPDKFGAMPDQSEAMGDTDLLPAPTADTLVEQTERGDIDELAQQSSTSPQNQKKTPSWEQIDANNWDQGPPIKALPGNTTAKIENPEGSVREGDPRKGEDWKQEMKLAHYGRLRGIQGADGEAADVFVTKDARDTSRNVYVIDQVNPETGKYDEAKVVMGAASEAEAREIYAANYPDTWKGLGAITQYDQEQWSELIADGRLDKPVSDEVQIADEADSEVLDELPNLFPEDKEDGGKGLNEGAEELSSKDTDLIPDDVDPSVEATAGVPDDEERRKTFTKQFNRIIDEKLEQASRVGGSEGFDKIHKRFLKKLDAGVDDSTLKNIAADAKIPLPRKDESREDVVRRLAYARDAIDTLKEYSDRKEVSAAMQDGTLDKELVYEWAKAVGSRTETNGLSPYNTDLVLSIVAGWGAKSGTFSLPYGEATPSDAGVRIDRRPLTLESIRQDYPEAKETPDGFIQKGLGFYEQHPDISAGSITGAISKTAIDVRKGRVTPEEAAEKADTAWRAILNIVAVRDYDESGGDVTVDMSQTEAIAHLTNQVNSYKNLITCLEVKA